MNRGNPQGFSLVEVVLVILLVGILAIGTLTSVDTAPSGTQYEATRERLERIRAAIVGDSAQNSEGRRVNFGFIGDWGGLPTSLGMLSTGTLTPAWTFDTGYNVGAGWKGPYLSEFSTALDATRDGFGNSFVLSTAAAGITVSSRGSDNAVGGGGYAKDLDLNIASHEWRGTVNGRVMAGFAPVGQAIVEIRYPVNGALTAVTTTSDVTTGSFSFSNVPFGARSLRITSTTALGPRTLVVDQPNFVVPDDVLNYSKVTSDALWEWDATIPNGSSFPGTGCTLATWFDLSTTAINGTLGNFGACPGSTGWRGTGITTDQYRLGFASNQYVDPSTAPPIGPRQSWSYEIWVYPSSVTAGAISDGSGHFIVDRTSATAPLAGLKPVSSGGNKWGFQKRFDDSSGLGGPVGTSAIATAAWTHLAVVRDYPNLRFRIFVNDVEEANAVDAGGNLTVPQLRIGRHCCTANQGLNGFVGYMAFYARALTQPEIEARCNALRPRFSGAICP